MVRSDVSNVAALTGLVVPRRHVVPVRAAQVLAMNEGPLRTEGLAATIAMIA